MAVEHVEEPKPAAFWAFSFVNITELPGQKIDWSLEGLFSATHFLS